MVIGLGAALFAATLFGVAAVLQAVAARHYRLFSKQMVLVVLLYVAGWGLHVVAIAQLPLYVAQVGIALSLVVTALVASRVVHEPLSPRHWVAIAVMVSGLVMLVVASGEAGHRRFDTGRTLALYLAFGVTLALGLVARRLPHQRSGVLLGMLAGIAYAGSPVATRSLVDPAWDARTVVPAFTIGLFGLLGFWLYSLALKRTSVTAATAPLVLLETAVPALVGLTVFGDQVRDGWWPLAVFGFLISTVGALVLCGAEARLEHLERSGLEPAPEHQPG